ncbi:MAG TPA: GNAT family N-acetyltransferase [Actinomycetes bacterium]|nr:GNAT family N-acetyltransferase [Actinomycetes bacterium]
MEPSRQQSTSAEQPETQPGPPETRPGPPTSIEPSVWSTSFAPPERIELGDVVLRRSRLADTELAVVAVRRSLTHLQRWMPWAVDGYDLGESADYLRRSELEWDQGTAFNYALVDPADAWLGSFSLMGRVGPNALEIGYWVAVDHVRRGLATLGAAALTSAGLALPDVGRIEIHHDRDNLVSGRIPARLGYVRLREQPAPEVDVPNGSGVHVVWAMEQDAWPGSPGAALVAAARGAA